VTVIKMNAALPKNAVPDTDAGRMWDNLGGHYMAIVELQVGERTEPADEDDTQPSAKLRITRLELARGPHDDEQLRKALAARHRARTAIGTLDEDQLDHGDGTIPFDLGDAILDYVNDTGELGGKPAKASRATDGTLTIDVDLS
jgi:hypothetical protein